MRIFAVFAVLLMALVAQPPIVQAQTLPGVAAGPAETLAARVRDAVENNPVLAYLIVANLAGLTTEEQAAVSAGLAQAYVDMQKSDPQGAATVRAAAARGGADFNTAFNNAVQTTSQTASSGNAPGGYSTSGSGFGGGGGSASNN